MSAASIHMRIALFLCKGCKPGDYAFSTGKQGNAATRHLNYRNERATKQVWQKKASLHKKEVDPQTAKDFPHDK